MNEYQELCIFAYFVICLIAIKMMLFQVEIWYAKVN